MLDFFNLQKQINKRIQRFLIHLSTEENIEVKNAKLLMASKDHAILVLLLNQNTIVKPITLNAIAAFFGKEVDESDQQAIMVYLEKLSKENGIALSKLNVIICETKGELGAHLYEQTKYKRKISTLDLFTHLNSNKQ